MSHLVKVELSKKLVPFTPNSDKDLARTVNLPEEGDFAVTVVNTSPKFASFQLELSAEGVDAHSQARWYRIEPNVCAKKPPGDRTTFYVTLLKAPIASYDVTIPLTVKVLSAELADLSAAETILLQIRRPSLTLRVYLPFQYLTVYPGDRARIPVLAHNLNPSARLVTVRATLQARAQNRDIEADGAETADLEMPEPQTRKPQTRNLEMPDLEMPDLAWFPQGQEQKVYLDSGESEEVIFWCAPPATSQSRHQVYSLLVAVFDSQGNTNSTEGDVEVLPFGQVALDCFQRQQWIPPRQMRLTRQGLNRTHFDLILHNQSNVPTLVDFPCKTDRALQGRLSEIEGIVLEPDESETVSLPVQPRRPWFGMTRTHFLDVTPTLRSPESGEWVERIAVQPTSQVLTLKVRPVIPPLLQLVGGLLTLLLLWLAWWLNPARYHQATVNTLTMMADGTTVISGSSDRTLQRWQRNPESWLPEVRRLKHVEQLRTKEGGVDKAVRTLQHLPRNVDQVAVGLENGEIQIWQIDPAIVTQSFFEDGKPDRVFGLAFTGDSSTLFSGHGSGIIRRWDMDGTSNAPEHKLYPADVSEGFSVSALTVVEPPGQESWLVGGGQFNRLVMWNWQQKRAYVLFEAWDIEQWDLEPAFIPVISRQNYLTSLASADRPGVFASADNQGLITVWDLGVLNTCMGQVTPPEQGTVPPPLDTSGNKYLSLNIATDCPDAIADQWQATAGGQAVRAIALSDNGCYLTSTGDDGRVVLWPLNSQHQRDADHDQGIDLKTYRQRLNTVDIHQTRDTPAQRDVLLVASDAPQNRVRLYRQQVTNNGCQ